MDDNGFSRIDLGRVKTPVFIVHLGALEENLKILRRVKEEAGCRILLAQKAFSMYAAYPLIRQYLDGVCSSSVNEARLGREEFGKEVHTGAPAYPDKDFALINRLSDCIVFNSFSQWERHKRKLRKGVKAGLRINPEYSEVEVGLYDPCAKRSRMGITARNLSRGRDLGGISGIHFHTMCQQGPETLERTLAHVEKGFGEIISRMEWVNFGGGHHITKKGYDTALLVRLIKAFKERYGTEVYLEPGEAVALDAGILVSTVLDIVSNEGDIAILDTSAEAHMPDVLAMPYRPRVIGGFAPGEKKHTYRLAGNTCLAGDVIGDYSFERPLAPGDKLVFCDMAIYSMVKTTTFNGIDLPSIALFHPREGRIEIVKRFGYRDFKRRV